MIILFQFKKCFSSRQILLYWGYEVVEYVVSYYRSNRQKLLQKVKGRYHNGGGKEKAA